MDESTLADYKRKGFAQRGGFGHKPVLLVVDFIHGFTDPSTPLGGDFSKEIEATNELLASFRRHGLPVVFTTISYEPDFRDAGVWIKKIPTLSILVKGSHMAEVDHRCKPLPNEYVVRKSYASAFFGTRLDVYLNSLGVDTVVMAGCTTSGCIRASAIDSLQYAFYTIVVREAVGDRAQGPHEANLFDIDAKYGDVISLGEALDYLESVTAGGGMGTKAFDDFQHWWNQPNGSRHN